MINEKLELALINYIARRCDSVNVTEEIKHYVIDDAPDFIKGFIKVIDEVRGNE